MSGRLHRTQGRGAGRQTPCLGGFSFSSFIFANIVAATATPLPAFGMSWPFVMETGALLTWFLV